MKKALYFDCFSGISGDMVLGALIDLGVDFKKIKRELAKLNLKGYAFSAEKIVKMGISGTDAHVVCNELDEDEERNLREIVFIIENSLLDYKVKERAIKIFDEIAAAEAFVHGKNIDEIHFHEVGAVDSIVDIVGVSIGIEELGVDLFMCSPLSEGTGFVKCRHGLLPVPVPAVLQMLKNSDLRITTTDYSGELITPTGIGILKGIGAKSVNIKDARIIASGYGFGKKETGGLNALRMQLLELDEYTSSAREDKEKKAFENETNIGKILDEKEVLRDEIVEIEANIDNMTGEMLGYVMEKLISENPLDVSFTPIQMKKNRPAIKLTLLCNPWDLEKFALLIIKETTSLGVRYSNKKRLISKRQIEEIEIGNKNIRAKISTFNGVVKKSFEYEDLAEQAREQDKPIFEIEKIIIQKIRG